MLLVFADASPGASLVLTDHPNVAAVRSDERRLHVLWRKVRWRAHWALRPSRPVVLYPWWDGMTLILPRSGSAAPAFYRTFPSEAIARWMAELLRPGMTVVDVGAHVGVYSLLAARLVGQDGVVHAIEPQHDCAAFIDRNGTINALANLRTHRVALAASDGEAGLVADTRSMGARLAGLSGEDDTTTVPTRTLRTFAASEGLQDIHLLKLDAAGNELAVLRGAAGLLDGAIGSIICKLYHPEVVAERFGAASSPSATVAVLRDAGYQLTLSGGRDADDRTLEAAFAAGPYTIPLLARRLR
jgi:FkbM family methyltransferase